MATNKGIIEAQTSNKALMSLNYYNLLKYNDGLTAAQPKPASIKAKISPGVLAIFEMSAIRLGIVLLRLDVEECVFDVKSLRKRVFA